jgi:hypothetical protein
MDKHTTAPHQPAHENRRRNDPINPSIAQQATVLTQGMKEKPYNLNAPRQSIETVSTAATPLLIRH